MPRLGAPCKHRPTRDAHRLYCSGSGTTFALPFTAGCMKRISRDRWQRVEAIFDEAYDLPAHERAAYLARACGEDVDLRGQVEALLTATSVTGGILETPMFEGAAAILRSPDPAAQRGPEEGERIGRFRVIRELGVGGMGSVYLAERADGAFEQRIALKLIRGGMDNDDILRRFLQERQILARLEHPHIARLVDGGADEAGRPFIAMEYVAGQPITSYCDRHALGVRARIELFMQVCAAVHYAHQNLVVHRDLKPSNILVTDDGQVKLLDFGIAKVLHHEEAPEANVTRVGLRVLTPDYAAPEQVRGDAVTTATDVYALGAILYELVSGRRAHRITRYTAAEVEREVCDHDPLPPSTAITKQERAGRGVIADRPPAAEAVSRVRGTTLDRLRRQLRGDLDAIVLQALQKEPARRYGSAEALQQDLRRYLAGQPVAARRESLAYRVQKFARRHAIGVAASILVALSLLAGLAGTTWQARVAAREAAKAREVSTFLTGLFEVSDPNFSNADRVTARELLDAGARRIDSELAGQPDVRAEMLALLGEIHRKLGLYEKADTLLDQALRIRRDLYGPDSPELAEMLVAVGNLRADQGRAEEAELALREALAIREATHRGDHAAIAGSLRDLAAVLSTRGELAEAESLQRRGLAMGVRLHGPAHAEVARDHENLSTILRSKGDYDGAIAAAEQALEIRQEVLGAQHLETTTASSNLALLLSETGDLDRAENLYREVLAFDLQRLGETHPYTATVTNNLAFVLQRKGDLAEAELLYRRVLDISRPLYGGPHPYVAAVINNLALVLRDSGRLEESEELLREALAMFRAIFDDSHYSVGTAHALLGSVVHLRGRLREADSLYIEGLARLRPAFPDGHPRTASALLGRGRLLVESGRASDAEALLRESFEMRRNALGDDDRGTIEARVTLAEALLAQNRFADAEALLTASWTALAADPYAARERAQAATALVLLYERQGRAADAARFRAVLGPASTPPR
jgi:eukaryotic-like serine/threonine-protein kinase